MGVIKDHIGNAQCGHKHWAKGRCAEMGCENYINKRPPLTNEMVVELAYEMERAELADQAVSQWRRGVLTVEDLRDRLNQIIETVGGPPLKV